MSSFVQIQTWSWNLEFTGFCRNNNSPTCRGTIFSFKRLRLRTPIVNGRRIVYTERKGIICNGFLLPVDPWAPSIDSVSIASQLFAFSLFPYLGFLYFITKSKSAPKLTLFGFYFLLAFVGATMKFVMKRGAGAADATPEAKRMRSVSPAPEHQLAIADAATAVVRPPVASPSRRKNPAAAIDLSGRGEGSPSSPVRLGGLSVIEGSRRYVEWLGQEVAKLEDEKCQSAEQLKASRAKLGRASTQVKALKADPAAQVAKAAEEAAEMERLRAELETAKGQLKAAKGELRVAKDEQGAVLKMYTKRLLLSDQFTELTRDLAGLINGNAVLDALEKIAEDNPSLDASKCGYQRLEGTAVYTQYAKVVRRHLDHLPLLNELASSPALLTAEMVASCSTDRDAELDAIFDSLPGEDVEMEDVGAGEEWAEQEKADGEPSSSNAAAAECPVAPEAGGEPLSELPHPQEKEVGDP